MTLDHFRDSCFSAEKEQVFKNNVSDTNINTQASAVIFCVFFIVNCTIEVCLRACACVKGTFFRSQ